MKTTGGVLAIAAAGLLAAALTAVLPTAARADHARLFNTQTGREFQPGEAWARIYREGISAHSGALVASGGHIKADLTADFSFSEDHTKINYMAMGGNYDSEVFSVNLYGGEALDGSGQLEKENFKIASIQDLVDACIAEQNSSSAGDSYFVDYNAPVRLAASGMDDDDPWVVDYDGQHVEKLRHVPIRVECREVLPSTETYARVKPIEWLFECPEGFTLQGRTEGSLLSQNSAVQYCVAPGDTELPAIPTTPP